MTSTPMYVSMSPLVRAPIFINISSKWFVSTTFQVNNLLFTSAEALTHIDCSIPQWPSVPSEGQAEGKCVAWYLCLSERLFSLKMEKQFDLPGLWSGALNKERCFAPGAAAQLQTRLCVRAIYIPLQHLFVRTAVTWLQHRPLRAERMITPT